MDVSRTSGLDAAWSAGVNRVQIPRDNAPTTVPDENRQATPLIKDNEPPKKRAAPEGQGLKVDKMV